MNVLGAIDSPSEDELVYQHGFQVRGWAQSDDGRQWKAILVRLGDDIIGASALHLTRDDVADALGTGDRRTGFVVRCTVPERARSAGVVTLRCYAITADDAEAPFATRKLLFSEIDYRTHGHGSVVTDGPAHVLPRDRVYGSGPPSPVADSRCVDLIMEYVHPGETVLDVGCGIGAYSHALMPHGVTWFGCETRNDFIERMRSEGLPVTYVNGELPFPDRHFDATICIEVLEHVPDYERFLAEVSRVSSRVAVFSVPNFGAIPITASQDALPWHMLESDHQNFFTARSLHAALQPYYRYVETFEYGPLPLLKSADGIAINNHVFAVCQH